jgi:hypothetical protein
MDGHSDDNNNNKALHGQSFGFLPFGSGRRICPTWKLGFLSVQLIILSNLVRQIDLRQSAAPKLVESSNSFVPALQTPLIVKARPRLPAQPFANPIITMIVLAIGSSDEKGVAQLKG